jgi:hypothetical protein
MQLSGGEKARSFGTCPLNLDGSRKDQPGVAKQ